MTRRISLYLCSPYHRPRPVYILCYDNTRNQGLSQHENEWMDSEDIAIWDAYARLEYGG